MCWWERKSRKGKSILASPMPSQVCECPFQERDESSGRIPHLPDHNDDDAENEDDAGGPGVPLGGKGPALTLASPLAGAHEVRYGTALISLRSVVTRRAIRLPAAFKSTPAEQHARQTDDIHASLPCEPPANELSAARRTVDWTPQTPRDRDLNVRKGKTRAAKWYSNCLARGRCDFGVSSIDLPRRRQRSTGTAAQ